MVERYNASQGIVYGRIVGYDVTDVDPARERKFTPFLSVNLSNDYITQYYVL